MVPEGSERETNAIVAALPAREGRRFAERCERMVLSPGDILCESNQRLETVYFPTQGVISLAMVLDNRPPLELGLVGRNGMLGETLSLGTLAAPMRAVVQVTGMALVMTVAQLQQELRTSPRLLQAVHHYQFRLMMQILQTAVCLHFHEIEPRLARWLLMSQDLSATDNGHYTHKVLSHALGVRRSGITLAAGSLQRRGLIRYSRGKIHILDRVGLEAAACGCHAALTDNYRLVFGEGAAQAE